MNQKVLSGIFAAAFLLAGCFPPLTGAPCSSNDNCPMGQVCGSDGVCVRGEGGGTGGGGDDGGAGGGTGGGAMGGGGGTGGGDDGGMGGGGGDDGGMGGGGGGDDGGVGGGGGDTDAGVAMMTVDRAMVDFGDVTINEMSGNEVITISNTGELPTGTLATTITGAQSASFQIGSTTCSGALGPMSSCQIVLNFLPTTAGLANAVLQVSGMPGGVVSTDVTGQGRFPAALSLMPTSQSFGSVVLGSTSMPQTLVVTNSGGSPSGIPSPTVTGADGSLFTITGSTCTAALPPAGTCQLTVVFVPTTSGSKSATLEVSATPGGTAMSTLTGTAQTPATLAGTPSPGAFGSAVVGSTMGTSITFTFSNQGEATSPSLTTTIGGANAGDFVRGTDSCQGQTVTGGMSCTVAVRFQPSASGPRSGTLSVSGMGITPAVIALGGTGQTPATLALSPTAQDFGSVATNASATATIGVTNTGEVATGSPNFTTGGSTEFTVTGNTCGMSTAPGVSCSVSLRFAPSVVGTRSASLTASASPGGMATASLTGVGVAPGALAITPVSRDFGSVLLNQSGGFQDFTVSNTGGTSLSSVTVTVGGAAAGSFTKSNDTCTGTSLPGAGTCTFRINFSPQSPGPLSGYVQVTASGGNTTQATLSGSGLRPASLSISPMSQAWPDTVVGTSSNTMTFTITNDGDVATGTLSTNLTGPDAAHFGFKAGANLCTGTLAGQASCTIGVLFMPTSGGAKQATLAVSATPGGAPSASLSGSALTPAALTLTPATGSSTNYGDILLGGIKTMSFTVTNTGQQASGVLGLTMTGADAAMFQIATGSGACQLGQPLAGGASCTSSVRFTAGTAYGNGVKTAVLTASASPGSSPSLTLTANVQNPANLVASTTIKDLGGIEVGQPSATYDWVIQNTGDVPTGTLSLSNTNAGEFQVSANTCTGTLAGGATCRVSIIFTPSAAGNRSSTLTLVGSPGGSVGLSVSGKGQWRLTLVVGGAGTGTLSTADGRLTNCTASSSCSALYDTVSVTVQARTANGTDSHFEIWDSPTACTPIGVGRDCSFTVSQSMSAKVTFGSNASYNLAFTSSTTEPANRGGVAPYDGRCNTLATAAGINNAAGNDYIAWMSDSTSNAVARLPNNGGWRRLDGSVFAVSRSALTSSSGGVVVTQLDLDERGVRIPNVTASTWTGTSKTGTYLSTNACSNWTSLASAPSFDRGRTAGGPGLWTVGTGGHTCNNTGTRIYCLQKSRTNILSTPTLRSGVRYVFLAPPTLPLGSRTAMDTYCNANKPTSPVAAATATYFAFVATTTQTAGSRLSAGNYYRTDGAFVGTNTQILAGALEAGMWQKSNGGYVNPADAYDPTVLAWTGAANANSVATSFNCSNWGSATTSFTSLVGRSTSASTDYFNGNGSGNACNVAHPVYCIQQ